MEVHTELRLVNGCSWAKPTKRPGVNQAEKAARELARNEPVSCPVAGVLAISVSAQEYAEELTGIS
jgi:hypothetical protein